MDRTLICAALLTAVSLLLLATSSSASDSLDRAFMLEEQLHPIGSAVAKQSPKAAATELRQWIQHTSPADIDLVFEYSRSNLEGGVLEVLSELSRRGAHAEALQAAEELDARVPLSEFHPQIVAVEAKLNLRLGRAEAALVLARTVKPEICDADCPAAVKRWLDDGKLLTVLPNVAVPHPWTFDERGKPCQQGYATDKLADFDAIDLVEASVGARGAGREQLAAIWPNVVAGCVLWIDKERLERLLDLGWTKAELQGAFAEARRSVSTGTTPATVTLLGAKLPLPKIQCNYAADATCKTSTVPLTSDSALSILERLRPLNEAWTQSLAAPANSNSSRSDDRLYDKYEKEMGAAASLDAIAGLASMRKILVRPEFRNLGIFLDSYSFGQGLERWSRQGQANEALAVFRLALDIGGAELQASPGTPTALALLQLRAGDPKSAFESLQERYAINPDERTADVLGRLRAALAGADLAASYPPPGVKRPWIYRSSVPICDFFDMHGLARIDNVDLIAAFQGNRKAALWQLGQEWPSIVHHCYDDSVWRNTLDRLHEALGSGGYADAQGAIAKSIKLGSSAHFAFAGQLLPLPDFDEANGAGGYGEKGDPLTSQRALDIIRESNLLDPEIKP